MRGDQNWVQTWSGGAFWPLDPHEDDVDILDIATSLAKQCRYAGHCEGHYSTAEHSCHLSDWFDGPELKKWALLHDSPETYILDFIGPIKRNFPEFSGIEDGIMSEIASKFGLVGKVIPSAVKYADKRILTDEAAQIMKKPPRPWTDPAPPLGITVQCWGWERARSEFLVRFVNLFMPAYCRNN